MRLILTLVGVALLATIPASPAATCREILGVQVGDDCVDDPDPPTRTTASRSAERALLEEINRARAARGLPGLHVHPTAHAVARDHARRMSDSARVRHNVRLEHRDVRSRLGSPIRVAENVGKAPHVESLHVAFMKSPGHRENILGRFDAVGVGVVFDGHTYWATEVFLAGDPATSHPAGTFRRAFHPAELLALPGGAVGTQDDAAPPPEVAVGAGSAALWLGGAGVALGLGIVRGARSRSSRRAQ